MSQHILLKPVFLSLLLISTPAFAEQSGLTQEMIEEFYHNSAQIQLEDADKIQAFSERHLDDNIEITQFTTTNIPNTAPAKDILVMNKEEFIASIPQAKKSLKVISVEDKLMRVDISKDKKTASIKDVMFIEGRTIMSFTPEHQRKYNTNISGVCEDVVTLTSENIIKIIDSTCRMTADLSRVD